jgi:hypothetical protein
VDQPLRVKPALLERDGSSGAYPMLRERTPVRMDLTHCGWSDIFFLGMDFPEGARVLNVSIDLGVHGRDAGPRPPVEAFLRVIDEPVIRLASVDLETTAVVSTLEEVFDFGRDYLGLLKAAIIAAGVVPPGIERSGTSLADLLGAIVGSGRGFELVSHVNRIPKGSRLAVSTNLLGALIGTLMRATGQIASLSGPMEEPERRMVAARAILGEWLGGSGGGWQDSGGLWPGMKLIEGALAEPGDPEHGVSRGRLLPRHTLLGRDRVPDAARAALQDSLVLVHGGMAQNVGPILEMVTEKYLLRGEVEWEARRTAIATLDRILALLEAGDVRALGRELTGNFFGPLQTIIPWVTNRYTEIVIERARAAFGDDFWGFWMLGGMSGGGMGFIVAPARHAEAKTALADIMLATKRELETSLPFAMDPVVYDFAINEHGSVGALLRGAEALLPVEYYQHAVPGFLRRDARTLTPRERADLAQFTRAAQTAPEFAASLPTLLEHLLPADTTGEAGRRLDDLLAEHGFDRAQHEQIRGDLRAGRIGLAMNRLPTTTTLEDVSAGELFDAEADGAGGPSEGARRSAAAAKAHGQRHGDLRRAGEAALRRGEVAVVTYAAGIGSRWTQGAGVVKALHPFAKFAGRHRSFADVHLAKSRRTSARVGADVLHVFTTSYLTHAPIEGYLRTEYGAAFDRTIFVSPGRSIGLRLVPTVRDLHVAWEETAEQRLDEQKQKMRESVRAALASWARTVGEGADYTDNLPGQCLHPVGHWFEVREPAEERHPCAAPRRAPAAPDARRAQHRHARCHARSHARRVVPGERGDARLGGHPPPHRGSRRRPRAHRRPPAPRRGARAAARGRRVRADVLLHQHLLDRHRPPAGAVRPDARRAHRHRAHRRRRARHGRADADLRHPERREEAVGARSGGHLPRRAVREALGRHDRPSRRAERVRPGVPRAWPAAQGPGAARRLDARRLRRLRRLPLRSGDNSRSRGVRPHRT